MKIEEIYNSFDITEEEISLKVIKSNLCYGIFLKLKEQGLTQTDLAKMMGVDKGLVSRWLGGVHSMTIDTLLKIGKILNIDIFNTELLNHGDGFILNKTDYEAKIGKRQSRASKQIPTEKFNSSYQLRKTI